MVKFVRGLGATLNAKPAAIQGVTTLEAAVQPWNEYYEDETSDLGEETYVDKIEKVVTYLLDEGAEVNREDRAPSPLLHDLVGRKEAGLLRRVVQASAHELSKLVLNLNTSGVLGQPTMLSELRSS